MCFGGGSKFYLKIKKYIMMFSIDRIYFIESLTGFQNQSARDLYKYYIDRLFPDISSFHSIETKKEFFEILNQIKHETLISGQAPFVHIESHGLKSKSGLQLKNGEDIYWSEMQNIFSEINKSSCNNLVLSLAACSSAYILKSLVDSFFYSFESNAPFFLFVGTEVPIDHDDLNKSFPEFYLQLNKTKDVRTSVVHMNKFSETILKTDNSYRVSLQCCNNFADTWIKERQYRIAENPEYLNGLFCNIYRYTYNKPCTIDVIIDILTSEKLYIDFFNKRLEDFLLIKGDCFDINHKRFPPVKKIINFEKNKIKINRITSRLT